MSKQQNKFLHNYYVLHVQFPFPWLILLQLGEVCNNWDGTGLLEWITVDWFIFLEAFSTYPTEAIHHSKKNWEYSMC